MRSNVMRPFVFVRDNEGRETEDSPEPTGGPSPELLALAEPARVQSELWLLSADKLRPDFLAHGRKVGTATTLPGTMSVVELTVRAKPVSRRQVSLF